MTRAIANGRASGADIDLDALAYKAQLSDSGEAFHLVSSDDDHRIGVVVVVSGDGIETWSIELLVRIFDGRAGLKLRLLENALGALRELIRLGHTLAHEDDGWISCTRSVHRDVVARECADALWAIAEPGASLSDEQMD